MARLPYMRVYVNDLFGDTVTLSDGEFGSYVAIIMAMWKAGGWLTLDQARKASKVAAGRWGKRWAALAGYFEAEPDGRITQERVRDDLNDVGRLDDRRSKGVSAETKKDAPAETTNSGPNPLKNNNPTSDPSRALAQRQKAEAEGREEEPPHPSAPALDWPDCDMDGWVKKLALMSHGRLDLTKEPRLYETRTLVAQWKLNGFSFGLDVVPTVERLCRKRKTPINGWEYFNRAIRESYAKRMGFAAPVSADDVQPQETSHHDDRYDRKQRNLADSIAAADAIRALGGAGPRDRFSVD